MLLIYSALSIDVHDVKLHSVWLNFPRDGRYTSHNGGMKTRSAFFKLQLIAARSGGGLTPWSLELALDKPEFTRYISMLFLIDWVRKIQIKHSFVPRAAARACNFTQQRVHWWVCIVDLKHSKPLASSEMILGKHNLWRKKTVTNFSELLESEKGNRRLHLKGFNSFVICFTFYMFRFSNDALLN